MIEVKYQAYPEYKDSGVEWLGAVPSHWDRLKFRLLADEGKVFASGPFGSSIGSQFYRDEGVPVIRGNNLSIDGDKPLFNDGGYVFLSENKADELLNAEVKPGDLIFTARGTVGQVGLVPDDGSISWPRAILSANQLRYRNKKKNFNSRFYWYLFSSWFVRTQILLSSDSVAQPNLNLGSLKSLDILLPLQTEQIQIVNFLDHETAKIDTLIEKQQQLIALLKEKRQAVISHAVSKGLNPDAPMKDSGVEWLGEVPDHWQIQPIKRSLVSIEQGSSPNAAQRNVEKQETRVLKLSAIKHGSFIESESKVIDSNLFEERFEILKNDLLVTRGNTPDLVADACVVKYQPGVRVMMSDLVYRLNCTKSVNKSYLCFWLLSSLGRCQIKSDARGSSMSMAKVSQNHIKAWIMPLPSVCEQSEIVTFLDLKRTLFEESLDRLQIAIDLLQERRTALISAAVTGKIDVRNWQPPTTLQNTPDTP